MHPLRAGFVLALVSVVLTPAYAGAAVRADRNHDKVFDSLDLDGEAARPVLVSLRVPASAPRLRRIERAVGSLGPTTRLRLVDAFAARATPAQIRALARRPDVAHVEDDAVAVPFGVTAQASFGVTRAREDIPGLDGQGLVAAVIDSGIDPTMADLGGAKVIGFKDLVNGRATTYDDLGHGSLVSGILAGSGASGPEGRGVAPAASLVGVKVIDSGAQSSLGLIAQGIQWAVENRAVYDIDAINLSIGDPVGCGDGTDVASQAVSAAVAAGIVVVTAAGNSGPANCTIKSPAAAEAALTVGAMADTGAGGFSLGWFSSRGPTADGRIKPDVSAAGVGVVMAAPGGGYIKGSGTSAAAPFVTGAALLMLQAKPGLTPAEIKDAMTRTAIDWGAPGRDFEYGSGRLDVYAALQAIGAPLATPPAVPQHRAWSGSLAEGQAATSDVDVVAGGVPLAVTMTGPSSGFDLSLRDETGAVVGTATAQPQASRQEDIALPAPAPGHYTVRVLARAGGGDFVADISGAFAPADTTAPALTLDSPAAGAVTNDPALVLRGGAGGALGDFPGIVARVLRDGVVVRRLGAVPLFGQWAAALTPPLPDGVYTVEAEQGDGAGNIARTTARTFTVDTAAPAAPVVDAPAGGTLQRTATVAFSGTAEAGTTITIREGATSRATVTAEAGGAWASALDGVADGTHDYVLTAADAAGNVSPEIARQVRVDTVPPDTSIQTAPAALVNTARPVFAFASEAGAGLACRLDGPGGLAGTYAPCTSPATLGPLADGTYRFHVRATDAAGNVGAPAVSADFVVDTSAPQVAIVATTVAAEASFQLTASEAGATLACRIDGGPWAACTPYSGLAPGLHAFEARATDAAGNAGPAARWEWTVASPITPPSFAPRPVLTLTVPRQRLATVLRGGLTVRVACTTACRTTLVLSRGRKVAARRTLGAPGSTRLRLSSAVRRALARSRTVTLTLVVSAPGAKPVTRRVTLKR